jgi:hypothetical protein
MVPVAVQDEAAAARACRARHPLVAPAALLALGRTSDAIAQFTVLRVHGARKRARRIPLRLEQGLAYQELLANADPQSSVPHCLLSRSLRCS